jgi:hypothetical protein
VTDGVERVILALRTVDSTKARPPAARSISSGGLDGIPFLLAFRDRDRG